MKIDLIGGKTIDEWDGLWEAVPGALRRRHPELKGKVGLLRFTLDGEIMYIGKAVEEVPGFFKRLYDFHRLNKSGRKHFGAELVYEHRDVVEVDVLIVKTGWRVDVAKELRTVMIERHSPPWNASENAIDDAIQERLANIGSQPNPVIKTVSAADVVVAQPA